MNTDKKHTEGKLSFIEAGMNQYILQAGGIDIFKSFAMVPSSQQKPNASRIVEAWNNFDDMKAALKDAYATLIRWQEFAPESWDDRDQETLESIQSSLAKLSS